MSMEPGNPNHPYAPPKYESSLLTEDFRIEPRTRQSGLGIASFVLAIVCGVSAFGLVVIAGYLEATTPDGLDEESGEAVVVGLGIIGAFGLSMLGVALGVAGLVQPNRARLFAILGLVLNGAIILGVCGLIGLGLSLDA